MKIGINEIWLGSLGIVILAFWIAIEVYVRIDGWLGGIGFIIPLFISTLSFGLFIIPVSYYYAKFLIVPFELIEKGD